MRNFACDCHILFAYVNSFQIGAPFNFMAYLNKIAFKIVDTNWLVVFFGYLCEIWPVNGISNTELS